MLRFVVGILCFCVGQSFGVRSSPLRLSKIALPAESGCLGSILPAAIMSVIAFASSACATSSTDILLGSEFLTPLADFVRSETIVASYPNEYASSELRLEELEDLRLEKCPSEGANWEQCFWFGTGIPKGRQQVPNKRWTPRAAREPKRVPTWGQEVLRSTTQPVESLQP
mmetsp:Transcript_48415/g.97413  ORF Transcript_48415/g.97413 Transcript_48415/m.97413 type:complete len:170 (-) Transcript_48415:73-582(-)